MIMTSVLGHVKELDFALEYGDWQAVPFEQLLDAPIRAEVSENMRDVAENLRCEAKKVQMLIIWTDCDREGEYIGNEISQICLEANPRLEVFRARYSVLNASEMHQCMRRLSHIDQKQVSAAELRSELDLRGGAAFTRLQTLNFRKRAEELKDRIISYGSCQFPTLGFVVEQYLRVIRFEEEPFWYIKLELKSNATNDKFTTKFSWGRHRLFDRPACIALYERCLTMGQATIIRIDSKPTTKWRPVPLRTVELQKFGSRYLKLSSDKIMEVAERLYNQGYISYPRTETDMFEPNFDLRSLLARQMTNPKWGNYVVSLLEHGGFRTPRRGKNNDKAHPPIHPTKDGQGLAGVEAKVYEFVARRFLACCSDDAKGLETIVLARIGEEEFRARGILVESLNYLEVYTYETWNDQRIGVFHLEEKLSPGKLEMLAGKTVRPKLLSESELIGSMDKNGIGSTSASTFLGVKLLNLIYVGTDATIHEHIKKIIERSYVIKTKDSRFHPTNLGLALVQGYDRVGLEESLTKPKLRALLEQHLSSICGGTAERAQVAPGLIHQFRVALRLTMEKIDTLHNAIAACASNGLLKPAPLDESTSDQHDVSSRRRISLPTDGCRRPSPRDDDDDFEPGKPRSRPANGDLMVGQEPLCNCNRPCKANVVKKDGPNRGRHFWSCSDCNFFQWDHDSKTHKGGRLLGSGPKIGPLVSLQMETPITDVRCNCGQPVAQRTVSKDGPNRGRQFYACAQTKENACQFFSWADQGPNMGHKPSSYAHHSSNSSKFGHSIKCGCSMEAIREITRGGANAGRAYYRCPKMIMRCGFFKWEDDEGTHSVAKQCSESFAISCYRCGGEGHFANACVEQTATDTGKVGFNGGRARRTSSNCRGRSRGRGGRRGGHSKRARTLASGTSRSDWNHNGAGLVNTEEF